MNSPPFIHTKVSAAVLKYLLSLFVAVNQKVDTFIFLFIVYLHTMCLTVAD